MSNYIFFLLIVLIELPKNQHIFDNNFLKVRFDKIEKIY